ncbi:MAG: DUF2599 domain-containing protein [Propionibacteriaceae bacterium]|nr:DUF2599 domain-containing protein [Propionibacteriaceae bacterium]
MIASRNSPREYAYEVGLPEGGSLAVQENGAVFVLDRQGDYLGAVAPPWAKDNSGASVPTHYEIRGTTLVQIVDHAEMSGIQYPVVADPWFGVRLFSSIWADRGEVRYNGDVSNWGATVMWGGGGVGGYAAGQHIMRTAGWKEWMTKYPKITDKATLKQQYDCHVLAGTIGLPFTGTYNLERARPNNSNWAPGVWRHKCNWV